MSFIRTTDRQGKPILLNSQLKAINGLLAKMERTGARTEERLIMLRDMVDRQNVTGELREKILTGAIQDAYRHGGRTFTDRHAANALALLNGTDRNEAAQIVESWGQDAGEEGGEGE